MINNSKHNSPSSILLVLLVLGTCSHCSIITGSSGSSSSGQTVPENTAKLLAANAKMADGKHGVKMGEVFEGCDDAKTDLALDWDGSPLNYTCYHQNRPYPIQEDLKPITECEQVPEDYMPQHFCMKDRISYNHSLPTTGDHRPLWPVFGEYLFVPAQRWLHNVEHGAIIMLYHPCAHPFMVDRLRKLVTNCIRKHVITRDAARLSADRPLALVTWGCRMTMNTVDTGAVVSFIKRHALHGPEGRYPKEGQYREHLIRKAAVPFGSTINDSKLCPFSFQD